jgi:hypothetical protein
LPEPAILLCGPALDAEGSAASLDLLRQVSLPNATKYLVTTGKFDAGGDAKTVNVETDYPADPPQLRSLLRWAEINDLEDGRFRDGYDLYCLRRILSRFKKFDYALVLRNGATSLPGWWPELQASIAGRTFLTFDGQGPGAGTLSPHPSLIIDLQDARTPAFLDAAWELYRTGAVYGLEPYSIAAALDTALAAVELEQALRQPPEEDGEPDVSPQPAATLSAESPTG